MKYCINASLPRPISNNTIFPHGFFFGTKELLNISYGRLIIYQPKISGHNCIAVFRIIQ